MAESETGQEKTETATAKKRSEALKKGQVPKSMEMNTAVLLLAGVIAFYFYCGHFFGRLMNAIEYYLGHANEVQITEVSIVGFMMNVGIQILEILAPFFIIFMLVALLVNYFQVGFIFTFESLQPNFNKMNPVEGIKQRFKLRSYMELVKSVAKMFIILPLMIYTIYGVLDTIPSLMNVEVKDVMVYLGYKALDVSIRALIVMIILAIIDYAYQRWQHEEDLKMTKEEVKQEMKDIQGDPHIKSRIRSIQQEMARKRMMQEVPESDVVVTNPTEYAIALKYNAGESAAPIVVAKGRGAVAKRIREMAVENSVPLVENRLLAQSLYKLVEVGDFIPPELYQAVAEVLAYVYRMNNKAFQNAG